MHRCLQIPELFGMICEFTDTSATLLNLATVCRLLSEPALDALWATYGDLVPLLKSMPPDLWQEESHGDDEVVGRLGTVTIWSFKRSPIPSDWIPFRKYSPKVYKISLYLVADGVFGMPLSWPFNFTGFDYGAITQNVLQEIQALDPFANNTLFPKVRSLGYRSSSMSELAPVLPTFLGPNLRSLHAESETCPSSILRSICHDIGSTSRNLKELRWVIRRTDEASVLELKDSMSDLLCQLDALESLELSDINLHDRCIKHVSSLPDLHTLSLRSINIDAFKSLSASNDSSFYFPKLRHYAHSHPPSLSVVRDIIKHPQASRRKLKTLFIADCFSCLSEVKRTFECIGQQVDHSTPSRFYFQIYRDTPQPGHGHPTGSDDRAIDYATLEPLLSFHNLEYLNLGLRDHLTMRTVPEYFFDLDDRYLKDAATAWPNLRVLFLGFLALNTSWSKPYKVTFGGILSLVKGCSKLERLNLRFALDPEDIRTEQFADGSTSSCCCSALHVFKIGDSSIRDGAAFAPLFVKMFPNLRSLSRCGPDPEWDKVESALSGSNVDFVASNLNPV